MYINVAQLLKENIGSKRTVQVNESNINDDINHIEGSLFLTRTECSILVEGKLTATASATCSRCLSPYEYNLDFDFAEEFFQDEDMNNNTYFTGNSEPFTIDRHRNIDISDAVIQYVSLAMPMKLLCRSDCAGICSYCGQNRNEGHCSCEAENSKRSKIRSI